MSDLFYISDKVQEILDYFRLENIYELISSKIIDWVDKAISMMPNFFVAVLVMLLFYFIGRLTRQLTRQLTKKLSENDALSKLLATIMFFLMLGLGFFVALSVLKLDRAVTSLLAGAGILGLALGFAFQDSVMNLIAGMFMAANRPFEIGDLVESADTMGEVVEMNLRNTVLLSFQGQLVYIPNKEVYQNKMINYTIHGKRRMDLVVGVSYGDDLKTAEKCVKEALNDLSFIIDKEKTGLFFSEFSSSSINGVAMFWWDPKGKVEFLEARSTAIKTIKKAFAENGITIPFPIRTLDFGIKGGEKLSSMIGENQTLGTK